jgi:hypothetical protein
MGKGILGIRAFLHSEMRKREFQKINTESGMKQPKQIAFLVDVDDTLDQRVTP